MENPSLEKAGCKGGGKLKLFQKRTEFKLKAKKIGDK